MEEYFYPRVKMIILAFAPMGKRELGQRINKDHGEVSI
jgi:hypothetical protein